MIPLLFGLALALCLGSLSQAVAIGRRDHLLERAGRRLNAESTRTHRLKGSRGRRFASGRGLSFAIAVVAGAVGFYLVGPIGLPAGIVGGNAAVRAMARARERKRFEALDSELREFVTALGSGVRAGLSVRRALVDAARDVAEPLKTPLDAAVGSLEVGAPLPDVLEHFTSIVDSADAHLVATVLDIHHRLGGDLPTLLDEAGATIGSRMAARRQARALTAQGRASGAVLAMLPVVFVGLLTFGSGGGLGDFYRSSQGSLLLAAGLGLNLVGFAWIRRIVGWREARA